MTLTTGKIIVCKHGFELEPVPRIDTTTNGKCTNTIKRVNKWLCDQCCLVSTKIGEPYVIGIMRNINPKNVSQSDLDTMNDYLFG